MTYLEPSHATPATGINIRFTPAPASPARAVPNAADIAAGFRALGIDPDPRKKRQPCPQCGGGHKHDTALGIDLDRGLFNCFRCGFSGRVGFGGDAPAAIDPAELQRLVDERDRSDRAKHERAARLASETWATLSPDGEHPYLNRKQIRPYGVRYGSDRNGVFIAIPMRDIDGNWRGLQCIYANSLPERGTDRLYTAGMQTLGAMLVIGDLAEAELIIVCEGYATGASVFEAGGHPVAVAFSAGNLEPVAVAIRARYPEATLIIAADNDIPRPGDPNQSNTGLLKARSAALASGALVAIPTLDGAKCDFNDVHVARGLDDVWEAVFVAATEPDPDAEPDRTEPEPPPCAGLGEKSDYAADLTRLRNSPTVTARQMARAFVGRYAWQSPRKRSFKTLADEVIAALPTGSNPAIPGSLRRFVAWLETQAEHRAQKSTHIDPTALAERGISYEERPRIDARLLTDINQNPDALWLIKAPHGTGKTESILRPLAKMHGTVSAITNRVSLASDLAERLRLRNYQGVYHREVEAINGLAICLPSLGNAKFQDIFGRTTILLIDEISATLRELHTLGGPLKKSGPEVSRILSALLNQARVAVGVDADVGTLDVLTLADMTTRPIRVIEIKPEPCGLTVEFDDSDAMKASVLAAIEDGDKVRVVADSSRLIIEMAALITARFPDKKVVQIQSSQGSSTAGDPAVLALLKDVNAEIHDVDVLLHSPTVESGVSIVIPHFTRTFGFYCGRTVAPAGFIQMLRRDRTALKFEVGLAGHGRATEETRPGYILNSLDATHRRTVELATGAGNWTMQIEPATPFDRRLVNYSAARALDKNDAHQNLLLLLKARGFAVAPRVGVEPLAPEVIQEARQMAATQYEDAVLNAAALTQSQRDTLETAYTPDPRQSAEIEKFDAALANGLSPMELDSEALRTYAHGRLQGWNRRFDALQQTIQGALPADVHDHDAALPQSLRRHGAAQTSAIHALFDAAGIDRATGAGVVTTETALSAFEALASSVHRPVLETAGITRFERLPKYPTRWLGEALNKFGLSLEEASAADRARAYRVRLEPLLSGDGLNMKAPGWKAMVAIRERRQFQRKREEDFSAPSAGVWDLTEPPTPNLWT